MAGLWCGLRSGEIRRLSRRDIDLESGIIRVEQALSRVRVDEHSFTWRIAETKTEAGRRTVSMPDSMLGPMLTHLDAAPLKTE